MQQPSWTSRTLHASSRIPSLIHTLIQTIQLQNIVGMPNPRKRTLDCRRQRKRDRARMTAHRALPTTTFVARVYPPVVDTFTVGPMDGVCSFCKLFAFQQNNSTAVSAVKFLYRHYLRVLRDCKISFLEIPNLSRNFHANIRQLAGHPFRGWPASV